MSAVPNDTPSDEAGVVDILMGLLNDIAVILDALTLPQPILQVSMMQTNGSEFISLLNRSVQIR